MVGPRRALILARLEGGPLAATGVIAGMSGSPVYVEGRLIGAVSYSLGDFSKEPIAGITPIAEMIENTAAGAPSRRARAGPGFPLAADSAATALGETLASAGPFVRHPDEARASGEANLPRYGPALQPIATPLSMAGFDSEARQWLERAFRQGGFAPVVITAGGNQVAAASPAALAPGDAVGISMVSGDLALGATGTVTMVDDGRVYAFGHPFFNLGSVELPMTRAHVHTILPSLSSSSKLASLGEIVGTIRQDRSTAIAGQLGAGPPTVALTVHLENDRGQSRRFSMNVMTHPLLTPLLAFASIASVFQSYGRDFAPSTLALSGTIQIKGQRPIAVNDLFWAIRLPSPPAPPSPTRCPSSFATTSPPWRSID